MITPWLDANGDIMLDQNGDLIGAAPVVIEAWSDGTFWDDGTGWTN